MEVSPYEASPQQQAVPERALAEQHAAVGSRSRLPLSGALFAAQHAVLTQRTQLWPPSRILSSIPCCLRDAAALLWDNPLAC